MENVISGVLMAVCLVVGLFAGAAVFSNEKIVEVTKELPVEKIVEVEVPGEVVEIEAPSLLDKAVSDFMKAVEDEEDEAGNEMDLLEGYDFEEISVNRVYDDFIVTHFDENEYNIEFTIKLKYKEDGEKSEKIKYLVNMQYEEDEDTEIETEIVA